ncbi:sodium/solute symporter [Pelagicoccus sp. SDUM812005]|uniref:sodium:solute symporter n=1 Tax=Pelagicoccus sp. SDUM812005 TaxID=3041257 RepID=UPI002810654B|nr:sodium/solute symporter [Pelagicoccus sp. SDUM812005]MDQ8181680.1 sodium/solute symporter [Pelagicoccus sp. SDUM812005]
MPQLRSKIFALLVAASLLIANSFAEEAKTFQELLLEPQSNFKAEVSNTQFVKLGGALLSISLSDGAIRSYSPESQEWSQVATLERSLEGSAFASSGTSLYLVESQGAQAKAVTRIDWLESGQLSLASLPSLPERLQNPTALVADGKLYLAGGSADQATHFLALDLSPLASEWKQLPDLPSPARSGGKLFKAIESIYYIGGYDAAGQRLPVAYYHPLYGWREKDTPPAWSAKASLSAIGDSHSVILLNHESRAPEIYLYHAIGDSWVKLKELNELSGGEAQLVGSNNDMLAIAKDSSLRLSFSDPETNYGWWDHLAVAGYFAIMIYVGFYFTKQSKTSNSFFRGSNNIPWWATGMSLFATGASALSLLSMPGKSYSTNWTFFGISIFSVICLPLSMYLLAPLVRKLNFATAFEYLEHRFGISVRMFGSAIFVMQQILGRMGPVMLLPAIAMNAITGIDVKTCIIAMGVVTTLYTFLGGLAAVIWTDTIQGFVMIAAVLGCLVLVYIKIDMPANEMLSILDAGDKLHTFNWSANFTQDNVMTMFFGILAITLFGISDQNYVQRVQCTPTLGDAKKAIATQMAVAVPINLLLFGLGTALFLFYRSNPGDLNPVMKTDGIFPFFAAQQLPPGVSGLVVAALLAATMSTISSAICSVSNLGVDDFYRRFRAGTTDREAVIMGRILTVVVGALGIAAALFLADFKTPSIWDLANRLISFITSATLGIFALGLFSKKANEIGVIAGIIAGIASTYYLKTYTPLSYWFYPFTGSGVTYVVGVAVSLACGGNRKPIEGLTVYTLRSRKGGLDDQ